MSLIAALAGNPNSGKTTLFNALTGASAHVGNWPGVTVEHKEGFYKVKGEKERHMIIDLPGIYSLTPYTEEEVISRNYLLSVKPDVIINIVDATNLERNLYLTTQLMEIDRPVVIALNFMDILEKSGGSIDIEKLSVSLGLPVVPISALKGRGKHELMKAVEAAAMTKREGKSVLDCSDIKADFEKIVKLYENKKSDNPKFRAVKLLEGDSIEEKNNPDVLPKVKKVKEGMKAAEFFGGDFEALIADRRYQYITERFESSAKERPGTSMSSKADKILTHKWLGIPIFLLIMFTVFHFVFSEDFLFLKVFGVNGGEGIPGPGIALRSFIGWAFSFVTNGVSAAMGAAPPWAFGLVVNGILAGLNAVLSFLPQILLLFAFLTILEDTGYMARVAFIMDRVLRRFGLSGRAFMPLLMCFGCAVPGIMATRALSSEREKKMSILLSPFFSCGAKLPVWAAIASVAFPNHADMAVFGIYILGIAVAVIAAIILGKTLLKGEIPPFILELPAYHMPHARNVVMQLWDKLKHYLIRAATIIAGASVIVWFLSNFSFTFQYVEAASETSMLGVIGKGLSYLFVPLGFASNDNAWKLTVAIFAGLIAKEMIVATLGILGGVNDALGSGSLAGTGFAEMFTSLIGPAVFAFMAFNLLSVPCMAAVSAARAEFKKKSYIFVAIAFWLITAYVVSLLVNWVGRAFVSQSPAGIAVFFTALALVAFTVTYNILKIKKRKKTASPGCGGNCSGCSGCGS